MNGAKMLIAAAVVAGVTGCMGMSVEYEAAGQTVAMPCVPLDVLPGAVETVKTERKVGPSWTAVSAGPRMGAVLVSGEAADALETEFDAGPVLTAWGWQFEYQYDASNGGPVGLVEIVPLILGLDQGLAIPTVNLLFGIRSPDKWEVVAGPNVSVGGVGMCFAIGKTYASGSMNMPVNFAIVSSDQGVRYSLTFGWNLSN
jgi:hypothetical protein